MTGLTDFITDAPWEDIMTTWYVVVDDAYQALEAHYGPWRQRGPVPAFSDSEVITVALVIETFFHGHEAMGLAFVRQYHRDLFPCLLPDGQFNERRRALGLITEQVRQVVTHIWGLIEPEDRTRLVDSAPIPVCTYARASRNRTVSGPQYFSIMASRKAKLFGLRLYLTITPDQVIDQWLLAPAAPHDSKVMPAVLENAHDLVVFGDGAFHDPTAMDRLRWARQIEVYATPRRDARQGWPSGFRRWATRLRRRVETALSVLVTVFHVEQPGSRSFSGLVARVATSLLAYTLCFITGPLLARLHS